MRRIYLEKIKIVGGGKIIYKFSCPTCFSKYLKSIDTEFVIEYPQKYDLHRVPEAVLAVPFIGNILTVSMLADCSIYVPQLDKAFYGSICHIKKAYKRMFPYLNLNFNVVVDKLVDCSYSPLEKTSLFFTGGVDASSALVETAARHPCLVNIWGGDVNTNDSATHEDLENYLNCLTRNLDLNYVFIKSNCREIYDEGKITKSLLFRLKPWHNHGWWASIAHILAMTTLLAPFAYLENIREHYIASSYDTKSSYFDANNDMLLAAIKFCSLSLVPVDSELDRTDKVGKIIQYCKKRSLSMDFKVCWYRHAGCNCSKCEKCYRTICDILINHGDPNQFGFAFDKESYREMYRYLSDNYVNMAFWKPIQNKFREDSTFWSQNENIAWILDFNFNRPKVFLAKVMSVFRKII